MVKMSVTKFQKRVLTYLMSGGKLERSRMGSYTNPFRLDEDGVFTPIGIPTIDSLVKEGFIKKGCRFTGSGLVDCIAITDEGRKVAGGKE